MTDNRLARAAETVRQSLAGETMLTIAGGIGQDLRYALRLLARNPGFATVAIISLALGIGANSAVFSLLNAVALRELDVRRPDQLVSLRTVQPNGRPVRCRSPCSKRSPASAGCSRR